MKRRIFLKGATGGSAVAFALASPVVAQDAITLRIAHIFSTNDARGSTILAELAARVDLLSGGTIQINETQSNDPRADLASGTIDAVIATQDLWHDANPAFGLFAATPGGLMERELEAWIRSDTGQESWDTLAATYDQKSLYLGDSGAEYLWSKGPIADGAPQGVSVATRGLAADVYTALGATIVSSQADMLFPSDASLYETGPLAVQYGNRADAPDHLYLDTLTRPSGAVTLSFSKSGWDGLTTEVQMLLDAVTKADTHRINARSMQANALSHQALKLNGATTITALPQSVWTPMMDASRDVFDDLKSHGTEARNAMRAYKRFGVNVQNWTRLSEAAFTTARARASA